MPKAVVHANRRACNIRLSILRTRSSVGSVRHSVSRTPEYIFRANHRKTGKDKKTPIPRVDRRASSARESSPCITFTADRPIDLWPNPVIRDSRRRDVRSGTRGPWSEWQGEGSSGDARAAQDGFNRSIGGPHDRRTEGSSHAAAKLEQMGSSGEAPRDCAQKSRRHWRCLNRPCSQKCEFP